MKITATLLRLPDDDNKQSLGRFYMHKGIEELLSLVSLELSDRGNKRNISRIPAGIYICKLRWSKKYQWHFEVTDVKDRSFILIHFGNYFKDTRGCILLGGDFYDINKDGHKDVTSSKKTIRRLMNAAPKEFELQIIDRD